MSDKTHYAAMLTLGPWIRIANLHRVICRFDPMLRNKDSVGGNDNTTHINVPTLAHTHEIKHTYMYTWKRKKEKMGFSCTFTLISCLVRYVCFFPPLFSQIFTHTLRIRVGYGRESHGLLLEDSYTTRTEV